jgi:hypothetical protein
VCIYIHAYTSAQTKAFGPNVWHRHKKMNTNHPGFETKGRERRYKKAVTIHNKVPKFTK